MAPVILEGLRNVAVNAAQAADVQNMRATNLIPHTTVTKIAGGAGGAALGAFLGSNVFFFPAMLVDGMAQLTECLVDCCFANQEDGTKMQICCGVCVCIACCGFLIQLLVPQLLNMCFVCVVGV